MVRFLFGFTKRWVAGDEVRHAINAARNANYQGVKPLLGLLGEGHGDSIKVKRAVNVYKEVLEELQEEKLQGGILLKLSQIGLDLGKGICLSNLLEIAEKAEGRPVWIGLEHPDTDDALNIYLDAYMVHKSIGLSLDSSLERSSSDLKKILRRSGKVMLSKGRHDNIGYNMMRLLFRKGNNFSIHTKDKMLLEEAGALKLRYHKDFEFHFPRGWKDGVKKQLLKDGFAVSEYIPFGKEWLPYSKKKIRGHF
jgi:proline dehydrogenase